MRYKNLIFDLYGTLVSIKTDEDRCDVWDKLSLFYGYHGAAYTPTGLKRAYKKKLAAKNMKAGQSYEGYPDMPVEPVLKELFSDKGVKDELEKLAEEAAQLLRICSTEYINLYPNVKKALRMLKKQGFGLYLLSNAQAAYTRKELKLLGIEKCFDGIYLSSDFGVRKPDPGFIGSLLEREKLKPDECLMIGNDMSTDIAGARRVGIDGLFVKTGMELGTPGDEKYTFSGNDWLLIGDYICAVTGNSQEHLTSDK